MKLFEMFALKNNKNSTNNCLDVGNTRIQWGKYTTNDNNPTVMFPKPFKDTNYSVTANMEQSETNYLYGCNVNTRTTTSFKVTKVIDNGGFITNTATNDDFSWMAIGLKP